ncbi:hypothetical protein [Pedobacter gandavensis]|uniref:hypothetical protein n=1 Tax=Pedobacter gandavensis TaxID=2679963 RepID=UPI00292F7967|nr:hypothetical protein [Pedobacter gandavensis]
MSNRNKLRYNQLTDKQILNPHVFISDFCRYEIDIEAFRAEILLLIKSACTNKQYGKSEEYFYNYRCLLKLLEAGHIFFCRDIKFSLHCDPCTLTPCEIDLNRYYSTLITTHFKTLSDKEIKNTQCFFKEFFSFMSLNEWRLIFSRIVEYAYRQPTIDEVLEDGSAMVVVKEYIEKLIEVIYLIDSSQTVFCINNTTTTVN